MNQNYIKVPSVTYAVRGRDILLKNGIKANFFKNTNLNPNIGCNYAITVEGNLEKATSLLLKNGIKIIRSDIDDLFR